MSSQRSDWRERLHANPSRMEQELAIKLQEDGICSRDIKSSRVSRHNTAETETAGRLGSFDVCNSKLELQCLSCHRMVATPPVSLLGWDNDLFLLVHLHAHQRLVKALNHFARA